MADKEHKADKNTYYVVAKNLDTSKFKVFKASELYEVTDDFKYWPFRPAHSTDFKGKTDYGLIEKTEGQSFMVRHYILLMTDNQEKAKKALDGKGARLKNPTRKSITPVRHPLSVYDLKQVKETVKQQKISEKTSKLSVQKSVTTDIVKRFLDKKVQEQLPNVKEGENTPEVLSSEDERTSEKGNRDGILQVRVFGCKGCAALKKDKERLEEELKKIETEFNEYNQSHPECVDSPGETIKQLAKSLGEEVKQEL